MPERGGREWAEGFQAMLVAGEYDRLVEFVHRNCVYDYPQSGERFVGIDNIRAVFENYPGGVGRSDLSSLQVAGDEHRWAIAPNFALVSEFARGAVTVIEVRARYPDGSEWYVVTMFELVEGKQARASLFFAPLFEAPEWRRPYTEQGAAAS